MLFVYHEALSTYRLSPAHPMQPERFTLALELARAWGLVTEDDRYLTDERGGQVALLAAPQTASVDDLELAHSRDYIEFVRHASTDPEHAHGHGIGLGDTPAFAGMHDAAALAVGASVLALESVVSGSQHRACNLAGGLHHAAYDHASGFCVYNDVVVAIKRARRKVPDIRIAYVDIDAHHGDGVEAAFAEEPAVLTISVHESGRYLFPGTGDTNDIGRGPGLGSALSLPLPMHAGPKSFEFAWREAILPALEAFGPDLIVLQGGADSHRNDPITHLGQTVEGYAGLVGSVLEAADRLCGGRAVLLGGGGYRTYDEAPRMWACAVALWLDRDIPLALPASWLQLSEQAARRGGGEGCRVLKTLAEEHEDRFGIDSQAVMQATEDAVARARSASPLLGGSAAGSFGGLEEQLADLIDRELDAGV